MADSKAKAAEEIAAGYVTTGKALELGTVVLDGTAVVWRDPEVARASATSG